MMSLKLSRSSTSGNSVLQVLGSSSSFKSFNTKNWHEDVELVIALQSPSDWIYVDAVTRIGWCWTWWKRLPWWSWAEQHWLFSLLWHLCCPPPSSQPGIKRISHDFQFGEKSWRELNCRHILPIWPLHHENVHMNFLRVSSLLEVNLLLSQGK